MAWHWWYYPVQLNSNWIDLRKNRSEKNFLGFEDRFAKYFEEERVPMISLKFKTTSKRLSLKSNIIISYFTFINFHRNHYAYVSIDNDIALVLEIERVWFVLICISYM